MKLLTSILTFTLFFSLNLSGQDLYTISDGSAGSCRGTLTDTDNNSKSPGKYDNSEDYKFTICVKGSASITFNFKSFCTEAKNDKLSIYKGSAATGTPIAVYHGSQGINGSNLPPKNLTVNDSCVTFHFKSDASIVCDGWEIDWKSKITQIEEPEFDPVQNPTCNTTSMNFSLDKPVPCDSLKPSSFSLTGIKSVPVSSVVPQNCINGYTQSFQLTFASPLNRSGNYKLEYTGRFLDICDSLWILKTEVLFAITDCPITVELEAKDTICKGSCTSIKAVVTGGNKNQYSYSWNPSGSGKGPITVCPSNTTTYFLTVSDGVSVPGKDSIVIVVQNPPTLPKDTVVCPYTPAFQLKATPIGGVWSGKGIIHSSGTFHPDSAGIGKSTVYYRTGECVDSMVVEVLNLTAGPPEAACPNANPFFLQGFSPGGGYWSGSNVTSAGLFTPGAVSEPITVTYHLNGCSASKTVNIGQLMVPPKDTVCRSDGVEILQFSPSGGVWSGNGITHNRLGHFTPAVAGPGSHTLVYSAHGCSDSTQRIVKQIHARNNQVICPFSDSFQLWQGLPVGGIWKGEGVIDSVLGWVDPQTIHMTNTFKNVVLTYTYDGCSDQKTLFVRETLVQIDTLFLCRYDSAYQLHKSNFYFNPLNGQFTGPGISGIGYGNQYFHPKIAGTGFHKILYEANGCSDSMIIYVQPRADIQKDTSFCIADDPFLLYNNAGNGTWYGTGVNNQGWFSPNLAGAGVHVLEFHLVGGCVDTVLISVNPLPAAQISMAENVFCNKDTQFTVIGLPIGGTFSGDGINGSHFNPYLAGSGKHFIYYTTGSGKCISTDSLEVTVRDPLTLTLKAEKDSACLGDVVRLTATQSGGDNNSYQLSWWNGINNLLEIYTTVNATQTVKVNLTDYCSTPVADSMELFAFPPVKVDVVSSDTQCFGTQGWLEAFPLGNGPWEYYWDNGAQTSRIEGSAGSRYALQVRNTFSGCLFDTSVTINSHNFIKASFILTPSNKCLDENNPEIQFIDMSIDADTGIWLIGKQDKIPYKPSENFSYYFDTYGITSLEITLQVVNEGGCKDTFTKAICMQDSLVLHVPSAFSPMSSTGLNDYFIPTGSGMREFSMQIYNRWGEKLFETEDIRNGWDGSYKGTNCPPGMYLYNINCKGRSKGNRHETGVFYLVR